MADQGGRWRQRYPFFSDVSFVVSFPREEIYTSRNIRQVVRFCPLPSLDVTNKTIWGTKAHPGSARSLQPCSRAQMGPTLSNTKIQFCPDRGLPDGQAHGTISFPRSHPIFQRVLCYWELWDWLPELLPHCKPSPCPFLAPKAYLLSGLLLSSLTTDYHMHLPIAGLFFPALVQSVETHQPEDKREIVSRDMIL